MSAAGLRSATASLLASAGLAGEFRLCALPGGANNRVFQVRTDSTAVLLKAYFRHPADRRDRLAAEFEFLSFAWGQGIRAIPRPLACDRQNGLGLYEFIAGRALRAGEVGACEVRQALDLFAAANRNRRHPASEALPLASEAFFSLQGHLDCVGGRVRRLVNAGDQPALEPAAREFIRQDLVDAWNRTLEDVCRRAGEAGLDLGAKLPQRQWRLSPSDFGFHNAIRERDGRLRFLDFEYAGWDDPAKVVCDFFWQVAVPVPREYFDMFVASVVSGLDNPEEHRRRISILFPVYQMKWACIVMNEFLPIDAQRRCFARQAQDGRQRHIEQLRKAQVLLCDICPAPV